MTDGFKETFSRIHALKFQNKLGKETMKHSLKPIVDKFFSEGLLLSLFVDIDDTTLYYINVWESLDATEKVRNQGKYQEAVVSLKKALQIAPQLKRIHLLLGNAYEAQSMEKEAKHEYGLFRNKK